MAFADPNTNLGSFIIKKNYIKLKQRKSLLFEYCGKNYVIKNQNKPFKYVDTQTKLKKTEIS